MENWSWIRTEDFGKGWNVLVDGVKIKKQNVHNCKMFGHNLKKPKLQLM